MKRNCEWVFWLAALGLGLASGYVHVIAPDPTIVALLALASAMFLGTARPRRPWQWATIIAVSIPAPDVYVKLTGGFMQRGRMEGAFVAGLVSGMVGAYAGALMRKMVVKVFEKP